MTEVVREAGVSCPSFRQLKAAGVAQHWHPNATVVDPTDREMPGYPRNADVADPTQPYVMCLGRKYEHDVAGHRRQVAIGARADDLRPVRAISHQQGDVNAQNRRRMPLRRRSVLGVR